jgi:hypothetical protein
MARSKVQWTNPWTKKNYLYLGVGIAIIVVGYGLMMTGISAGWDSTLSVSVAPVVLVIGFCVAVPLAIMANGKNADQ